MRELIRPFVGIVGVGMVGDPIRRWFGKQGYRRGENLFCYDTDPSRGFFDDVTRATVIFVCVPTPPDPDGSCNTSIVESVVYKLPAGKIVVIKSTVPPGTTQRLQDHRRDLKLMFCPEFLTESQAWADFIRPNRQLIGVTRQSLPHAIEVLQLLPQALFQRPDTPIYGGQLVMNSTEVELAKYASNVFGALKVTFANVLADVAYNLAIKSESPVRYEYIRGAVAADQRIGPAWMDVDHGSYSGFGGYCFPKDMAAFIETIRELVERYALGGKRMRLALKFLRAAYAYNEQLLADQGLTVADVSQHDKQIVLDKRRPTRDPVEYPDA
ncbi:MAG TPA: hypothetical protein VJ553_05870 [Candidatus Paceibacterota bacterium]|nr:hypothetical protein [Candidatus Paceibacterota bacterium]